MNDSDQKFKDYIESHPNESHKSALKISMAIQNSPLEYEIHKDTGPVAIYTHTLHIPKFYTQKDRRNFESLCRTFSTIFDKTIRAYKQDEKVRKLFAFDPRLEELVMKDCRYKSLIPMLRIDVFYSDETGEFKVCEFNTDGTSAMYENQKMDEFLALNNAFMALKPDVEHQELMNSWADAFLEDVKEASGLDHPSIVIADYLENSYRPELDAFADLFTKRGYTCEVVDVRELVYENGRLKSRTTGTEFDAVYRRAVTSDVMDHYDESKDLLDAVRDDAIVVIGGFQTQIIHSKAVSEALLSNTLRKYFTDEEVRFLDEHLPASFDLTSESAAHILEEPKRWIIKPSEGYGAKGVYAGVDLSKERWKELVEHCADKGFIVQEYIPHPQSINIDLLGQDGFRPYSNLTGLYVYNGKFAGVYSRLSDSGIVSTQYNEKMVPTLFLKEEQES